MIDETRLTYWDEKLNNYMPQGNVANKFMELINYIGQLEDDIEKYKREQQNGVNS